MNSNSNSLPSTLDARPSTPPSDDEVLVRVEGVSKKFCRSLKKSLWYGVCDIATELNPFGRTAAYANPHKNLTTEDTESTEGNTGVNQLADSAEFLEGHSQAGLQMDSEKPASIRSANAPSASGEQTGSGSESLLISEICGQKNSDAPDGAGLRDGEFWAVKDVSFELRRGECLGLIGHNGAGKTTLLKMLNGLIKPDAGSITMRGRVGALIALGAGFNPILTGRENIYINGSVLGLTKKEIDDKIDEIIDFAELREFIDMPVQSYSSGMAVRLGFAVATTLEPDILILDEVLAVGDVSFRFKCGNKIRKLLSKCAVIFVSHSMDQVGEICSRGLLLNAGTIYFNGSPEKAIEKYLSLNKKNLESPTTSSSPLLSWPIKKFTVNCSKKVGFLDKFDIRLIVESDIIIEQVSCRLVFFSASGIMVAEFNSRNFDQYFQILKGETIITLSIKDIFIKPGCYQLDIHLNNVKDSYFLLARSYLEKEIQVIGDAKGHGHCVITNHSITTNSEF